MFFVSFFLTLVFNVHFLVMLSKEGRKNEVSDVLKRSLVALLSAFFPVIVVMSLLYSFVGGHLLNFISFTLFFVVINFLFLRFLTPAVLNLLESF